MKYKVIEDFKDLKDNNHIYRVGDEYPRKGIKIEDVDDKRIKELSGKRNKLKKVLIIAEENTKDNKNKNE